MVFANRITRNAQARDQQYCRQGLQDRDLAAKISKSRCSSAAPPYAVLMWYAMSAVCAVLSTMKALVLCIARMAR